MWLGILSVWSWSWSWSLFSRSKSLLALAVTGGRKKKNNEKKGRERRESVLITQVVARLAGLLFKWKKRDERKAGQVRIYFTSQVGPSLNKKNDE